jgi:hypothetical protein
MKGAKMSVLTRVVLGVIVGVIACNAQAPYRRRGPLPPNPTGRYEISNINIANQVGTLDQLVRASDLIIDGTVHGVLSSPLLRPDDPASIETNSQIIVNEVLRGESPGGSPMVVLAQKGGAAVGYEIVVPDDPLVQPGDRYILFLQRARRGPENKLGVPRYWAVGFWSGKVKISEQGTIQFLPASAEELHSYDGWSVSTFVAAVNERIEPPFGPRGGNPRPLPPGVPIPPTGPPIP